MKFIILAGGSGTRLWPASRKNFPKQFLKISLLDKKEESFFQKTLRRLLSYGTEIFIVTNEKHRFYVLNQTDEVLKELKNTGTVDIVLEPVQRNTAPAIALGIKYALEKKASPREIFFVCPSDHLIHPDEKFLSYIKQAEDTAKKGYIVTFGIKPLRAETGYGYIKANIQSGIKPFYEVESFVEKPDTETAKKYFEEGCYFWNSGIFVFRADVMIEELNKYSPELGKILKKPYQKITKDFQNLPDISIDYAVMEKTDRAVLIPLDIFWSDIGSWESFYEILDKDEKGNAIMAEALNIDTEGSLIVGDKRLIATIGLKDIVVVETEDALLIARKGECQKVKEVVKILSEKAYPQVEEHLTVYRPWGSYTLLEKGLRYKIKKITVNPGQTLSLQMHHHRSEHWVVVKGTAKVRIGDSEQFVHENESVYVPKSTLHRLENPGKVPLEIIEVQVGEYVEEDDIKRFEDIYGRSDI